MTVTVKHVRCGEEHGGSVAIAVMRHGCATRPGSDRRAAWVRSGARIWDLSPKHKTIALSGGSRYRPTTSMGFSLHQGHWTQ